MAGCRGSITGKGAELHTKWYLWTATAPSSWMNPGWAIIKTNECILSVITDSINIYTKEVRFWWCDFCFNYWHTTTSLCISNSRTKFSVWPDFAKITTALKAAWKKSSTSSNRDAKGKISPNVLFNVASQPERMLTSDKVDVGDRVRER